jgi:hypothetical protein
MSPVTTLLKTFPRARNDVASTAPVASVSSTTSESLMDTCERIMADPNLWKRWSGSGWPRGRQLPQVAEQRLAFRRAEPASMPDEVAVIGKVGVLR